MAANPALGVFLHSLGGFASGSFYIPYRKVKNWAWESYWITGGTFSWIIAPWVFAVIVASFFSTDPVTKQPCAVSVIRILRTADGSTLWWTYFFGAMWGVGGLTFGLTMRYLGMSLGMAVALGFCSAFGTLVPAIYDGILLELFQSKSGLVTLGGVVVCLGGIALCGRAGIRKEREMPDEAKKAAIAEFNFAKGMIIAVFSGVMSACMAFALRAGEPIGQIASGLGVVDVLKNTPKLIVVMAGGFTTNVIWCMYLNAKNGTFGDYRDAKGASLLANYVFSALAGTTWYLQFFFYDMGSTQMGRFGFSSWTLHMATIIIFSNMWGLILHEWRGASARCHLLIRAGITVLILSTVVVGYGNYLKLLETAGAAAGGH